MDGWICETPGCGHNRSWHRSWWNKFRGEWDRSCTWNHLELSMRPRCKCGEFTEKKKEETA